MAQTTTSKSKLATDIEIARLVGTPLIAIQTTDPAATIASLLPIMNGSPVLAWDCVRGLRAVNKPPQGENPALLALLSAVQNVPEALQNLVTLLDVAQKTPSETVIYVQNAHLFLSDPPVQQAIWNLRDSFKVDGRSLILTGVSFTLPPTLAGDVMVYDEPLPTPPQIEAIISEHVANADLKPLTPEVMARAVDAATGLTAFAVEQNTALSLRKSGIDIASMQARRCAVIEQTPGLSVWTGTESFSGIGGNENIKRFISRLIGGAQKFAAVWWIDEIEKQMAGRGDMNGLGEDQHGQLLQYLQNRRVQALLLVGHPGVAKSEIAKATGNEAGVLTLGIDMGEMLGSLVGLSQERVRTALKVGDQISAGRPLVIATCNDLTSLSPELRSRFKLGTFFFDLPTAEERDRIWQIHAAKNGLTPQQCVSFDDTGWTGREIAACCELAVALSCDVKDASQYIVPVSTSQAAIVERRRTEAHGRFISASYAGTFDKDRAVETRASVSRKIGVAN